MADILLIKVADRPPQEAPLSRGLIQIGSDARSDVRIAHPEIASHAATLDFQNGAWRVQNRNPFEIYVDAEPLAPSAWSPWRAGQEVLLTRNVALVLKSDGQALGAARAAESDPEPISEEDAQAARRKTTTQVAIIGALAAVAAILLIIDQTRTPREEVRKESFQQLVRELEGKSEIRDAKLVRRYLQDAWKADRQGGDPAPAISAYRRLLLAPDIRRASAQGTKLGDRVKRFANQRIIVLESGERR